MGLIGFAWDFPQAIFSKILSARYLLDIWIQMFAIQKSKVVQFLYKQACNHNDTASITLFKHINRHSLGSTIHSYCK